MATATATVAAGFRDLCVNQLANPFEHAIALAKRAADMSERYRKKAIKKRATGQYNLRTENDVRENGGERNGKGRATTS